MQAGRVIVGTIAVTGLLFALGVSKLPGAGLLILILPLPLLFAFGRVGVLGGCLAATGIVLLLGLRFSVPTSIGFLTAIVPTVLLTTVALTRGVRLEGVVALAAITSFVCIGGLAVAASGDLVSFSADVQRMCEETFDRSLATYRELSASPDLVADLIRRKDELSGALFSVLPGLIFASLGALWFGNLWMASRWGAWPQFLELSKWQASPLLIWALIASGFGLFAPIDSVSIVARNGFVVMVAFYFFQGLAIVQYFLKRVGVPRSLRIVSYFLIGLQQVLAAGVLALGVFDLWGDFRRLRPVSDGAGVTG